MKPETRDFLEKARVELAVARKFAALSPYCAACHAPYFVLAVTEMLGGRA